LLKLPGFALNSLTLHLIRPKGLRRVPVARQIKKPERSRSLRPRNSDRSRRQQHFGGFGFMLVRKTAGSWVVNLKCSCEHYFL
jgi:hypothetical protein